MKNKGWLGKLKGTPRRLQQFYEKKELGMDVKAIWLGVTAALGVWIVAALLGLFWIWLQGTGAYWLGIYVYLLGILGVFIGSFLAGSKAEIRGWLHGLWVGLFLGLIGIIINLELAPQIYSWWGITRHMLVWTLWGITGGYLGQSIRLGRVGKEEPKWQRIKKKSRMY